MKKLIDDVRSTGGGDWSIVSEGQAQAQAVLGDVLGALMEAYKDKFMDPTLRKKVGDAHSRLVAILEQVQAWRSLFDNIGSIDADTVATAMETFEKHGFMADLAKKFMTEVLQPTASEGIKSRRDEGEGRVRENTSHEQAGVLEGRRSREHPAEGPGPSTTRP